MEMVAQLHIRYEGRSLDFDLNQLDLGPQSTDNQVREAVANFMEVPHAKLRTFAVDRNQETGAITVRPEAVFG